MIKMLKRVGIILTLVVVLAVLVTSAAMAAGPNNSPGTCPNPDCPGDCDQLQLQEQVRTCNGNQTQNQNAGELSKTQTKSMVCELQAYL